MKTMSGKNRIVIGIDQSYQDSGITVSMNGHVKAVTDCYTANLKSNTDKRKKLREKLNIIFGKMSQKAIETDSELICIIERIRLRSGKNSFINIDYIKAIGALNALIIDLASEYSIPVYSVETRAWKAAIIGTAKEYKGEYYGIDPKKVPTILWCIRKGYESRIKESVSMRKKKGVIEKDGKRWTYNDNKADSIGISLYGFVSNPKLEGEK